MSGYPFTPDWVTCPGETLAEWFEINPISKKTVAKYGIDEETLAGLLAGIEPVTARVAANLTRFTFIPARFWLNLEHNYRAGLAAGLTHDHDQPGGCEVPG